MALRQRAQKRRTAPNRFLTIDIGGSGLKAAVVDRQGEMLTDRVRVKTPPTLTPQMLVDKLVTLVLPLRPFDRVSVGFPGVVRRGVIITAPNLGTEQLRGCELAAELGTALDAPVRVENDATVQGYGAMRGDGVEMVITLGTGFGAAIFEDGRPLSTLELGHHPFRGGDTYEEQLGVAALKAVGKKRWNRRLAKAITILHRTFYFDRLYLGGGNAKKVTLDLGPDTEVVSNTLGVTGGPRLWVRSEST